MPPEVGTILAVTAIAASVAGTAASIATQPDPIKPDDILQPPAEDEAAARRQQKIRAAARLGAQKTIVADSGAPEGVVGTPTLLGG